MSEQHTIIVGGGVIGVCCAYELARRGSRVTLVERDRIGGAASFGNAGSIAPGHAPINRPGVVWQAMRWMLRPTSPIYIAPRADPALARWLWRFRSHCTERHRDYCMGVLGPLGHLSQALFDRMIDEERLSCDYRNEGYYEIYRTENGFTGGRAEALRQVPLGYDPRVLSGDEVREREPALAPHVRGAVWHTEGATCNPHTFVRELAARAEQRGAEIRTGVAVERVEVSRGRASGVVTAASETIEADTVLLATGVYSQQLLRDLGPGLPLQPAKGYHRDVSTADGESPGLTLSCLLAEDVIFCSPIDDFVRLAGTLEFSGLNHDLRRSRVDQLTRGAAKYFDRIGTGDTRSEWCGLRPCLPDGLPAVGWVPGVEGVFVANGHAMMGLTLGPITGRLVAESILDRRPSFEIGAMRPDRF